MFIPTQNRYTEPLGNEPKLAQKGVYPYHHRYTASQGDKPAHELYIYTNLMWDTNLKLLGSAAITGEGSQLTQVPF
jgi:hypothetical protein